MPRSPIVNPHISSLLPLERHTNRLAMADGGFPCWPRFEAIGISLVDDVPRALDAFTVIRAACSIEDIGEREP